MASSPSEPSGRRRLLPRPGSPTYHVLLAAVALLILGPLGGISAAFMNFSIGFYVGGQVLAGILGSTVTLPYGPEGKHGANYIQTMAASVAGMSGMGVVLQAMVWLGLPEPPFWHLVLYLMCIGMFGVGVGMLYTPILVDRMQLPFPSGVAVANILRALTDRKLLRRSVAKLGGGMLTGYGFGLLALARIPLVDALGISTSTFGAGMIVGARLALPALVVAGAGELLKPYLVRIGWLDPGAPFRQVGFIFALGTILGAAFVDVSLILVQAVGRWKHRGRVPVAVAEDWKRVNTYRLLAWIVFWGAGILWVGSRVLHQPLFFLGLAVVLSFLFVLVNGIADGISDSNPVSSAFVMFVFIMTLFGLQSPGVGLMCGSIVLIACTESVDMQQDRSTGWRLGTNRVIQFRYQVIGIAMGAFAAVALAKIFMASYDILKQNQFDHPHLPGAEQWQSAMTYKFVGALENITHPRPHMMKALLIGVLIGLATEVARKLLKWNRRYQTFAAGSRTGRVTEFVVDTFVIPSPYASSFGGFVSPMTSEWWAAGGVASSLADAALKRRGRRTPPAGETQVPPDMSSTSLVGGGLIAGDSLAALTLGIFGLLKTVFFSK